MDGHPRTVVIFPEWDCRNCKVRSSCTTGFTRRLTLHPREEHELLQRQRTERDTDEHGGRPLHPGWSARVTGVPIPVLV